LLDRLFQASTTLLLKKYLRKYNRILLFLIFYISQARTATH